jgi:hypothetical protein
MEDRPSARVPGWGEVALDTVIALLFPKVGSVLAALVIPPGIGLAAAGLVLVLLAFFLVGKVRGAEGLPGHLAKVVGVLAAITLLLSREPLGTTLLGLVVLAGCAALGGWMGSRRG